MRTVRIDNFSGNDHAYIAYLYTTVTGLPLPQCIHQLEEEVKVRRSQSSQSPQPRGLCFELWVPPKQGVPSDRPPVDGWKKSTKTFFEGLPKTEDEWHEKRESLHLSTADDILRTADFLTAVRRDNNGCSGAHAAEPTLQLALTAFGRNVGFNLASDGIRRLTARFLPLVFLATCCVAIHQGHPVESVDAAQIAFLKASRGTCDEGPKSLAKDRAAVRWLIGEMQRLFRRGLRHRAFELFLLAGRGMHFYKDDCPKDPKANAEFTALIPSWDVEPEIQASLPFFIPFFVMLHFGEGMVQYLTICEALELNILNQEDDFRRFQQTYASRKLVVYQLTVSCIQPPNRPRKLRKHAPK
ncbi:hypothetical protein C8A05DRAFT_17542, partial [Staphylotrichum tortipilum]